MKHWTLSLFAFLLPLSLLAQTERVYVATDRCAYLSGEPVWCSLFCVNENGLLSRESAVAYVELVSAEGTAAEAKIGLLKGRGCGTLVLPVQVPTGNYRLMAYTLLEGGEKALQGSKLLSVYNPYSVARVKGGVQLGVLPEPVSPAREEKGIRLSVSEKVAAGKAFTLAVEGVNADVAVSVYHEDGLEQVGGSSLEQFLQDFPISAPKDAAGEYDGEVIHGNAVGAPAGSVAILSSAGSPADTYFSVVEEDGSMHFATGNIYGDREIVCVVPDAGDEVRIRLDSPFLHPAAEGIPALRLDPGQSEALIGRKNALSVLSQADTLYAFLPRREDLLLSGVSWEHFHLDDYTRFHTVQEIITEILPTVRLRKDRLELSVADGTQTLRRFKDRILVMMDGVVIPDMNLILKLDAMLLEDIDVCTEPFSSGAHTYDGIVNFVSKMNYVRALDFPENVYVLDFQGVSYPLAYLGAVPAGPDGRQVLYWNPSLCIKKGENQQIHLVSPSYKGRFFVVAEGLSEEGKAVRAVTSFEVD